MKPTIKRPKLVWIIQFASSKGGTAYVKQQGKIFVFVTTSDQATEFLTLADAEIFADKVRQLSQHPKGVVITSRTV